MKRLLFAFLCIICLRGFGQQNLSVKDAVSIALKNSYDIQISKDSLDITVINNYIGVAGGLPSVTGTLSDNEQVTSINQKYADPTKDARVNNVASNNSAFGVTGSFLLYNGRRVMATRKRLDELAQQNQQYLNFRIQYTIAGVMTKYYDVVRQENYLKTIFQSIDVSKKKLEILKVRQEVGMSNNADVIQAQVDLNALLQAQKSQELIIDQAKTDLLTLIFIKADSPVKITDTILVDGSLNIENITKETLKNPALVAADQQIIINKLIEKETAALRYPSLKATTGYNFTSAYSAAGFTLLNQSFGPFVGLSLSIPFYNGGAYKRQQQVAEVNTRIAKAQRDELYLFFESGTLRTYQSYKSSLIQLQEEQQNYILSRQLLDLVLQRFELGQATIIDVKLAQESFEGEGYRLINLKYAAKAAEIELKRLSSQLN